MGRGSADKVFVTASGAGVIPAGHDLRAQNVRPGDDVPVNGVLGNHGAAILAARRGAASALNGIAQAAGCGIEIDGDTLPIRAEVQGM